MKSSKEFIEGKHNIGYTSSTFNNSFNDVEFKEKPTPTKFQTLLRSMNDEQIESELKPGLCELGDVIAFMDNAPEECKDGNWNLFYLPSRVVCVFWHVGAWGVHGWGRGDYAWDAGIRVFSSETFETGPSRSMNSDTLKLEEAIKIVKKEGYKIIKEI